MSKILQNITSIVRDTGRLISDPKVAEFRLSLLLVPLAISVIVRLPFLLWPDVIYTDSVVYIKAAKGILEGKWSETIVPPLYPAFIAAGKILLGDFESAGIVVSLVFSSLLCLPIYYLGNELYNARVGMVAALLATVQPYFFKYSGAVLTEAVYYFLVASTAFLALKAHTTGRSLWIALLGFVVAMAYLSRPEALGFLAVFTAWALLCGPRERHRSLVRRISIALMTIVCFLAFASPYLFALRNELGRWELSKKAYVTAGVEDADSTKTGLSDKDWKPTRYSLSSVANDPVSLIKIVVPGVFVSFYKFQISLGPLLFLMAIWGFMRRRETGYPWRQNFLLLSFMLFFFALVFPYFKISARYSSHMIPIAMPWVAYGFLAAVEILQSSGQVRRFLGKEMVIALIAVMAAIYLQGAFEGNREHRELQREVGRWLKHNAPQGEKVMSRRIQEAFYADLELVRYQGDDLEGLLEAARTKAVSYVIVDQGMVKSCVDFTGTITRHGLVPMGHWKKGTNQIWVFSMSK